MLCYNNKQPINEQNISVLIEQICIFFIYMELATMPFNQTSRSIALQIVTYIQAA